MALSLGTLALGIAEFSMMSILSAVAADLKVSIPEAGHFISAYATGVCAGVLLMVTVARSMPLKSLLLCIVGLMVIGNGVTALASGYGSMLASRFVAGLPHGAYFGVGAIIATKLAQPGCASRDVCLMVAGMTVANLIGVPLGSFLAWAVSWRCAFVIVAAVSALVFLTVLVWLPKMESLPDKGFSAQFHFLGSLEPWLVFAAIGFGNGGFFAYYSYVNPTMERVAGVAPAQMSLVITLAGAAMVFGNLLSAKLSRQFSNQALAACGQGTLVISLISLFFFAEHPVVAVLCTMTAAGSVFFISGPEQVLILQNARDGQLLAAALGQCAFNGGNALGAWLGGLPIDAGKPDNWAALPGVGLAFVGFASLCVVWWILWERCRYRHKPQ